MNPPRFLCLRELTGQCGTPKCNEHPVWQMPLQSLTQKCGSTRKEDAGVAASFSLLFASVSQPILLLSQFSHLENGRVTVLFSQSPPSGLKKEFSSEKERREEEGVCRHSVPLCGHLSDLSVQSRPYTASALLHLKEMSTGISMRKWSKALLPQGPTVGCKFPT